MSIESAELPRLEFTRHELYVLRYAELSIPIPAEPETLAILIDEKFIEQTSRSGVNKLTELGRLACDIMRAEMRKIPP